MSKQKISTLGEFIRELREKERLPIRKIAAQLDIDPSLLGKIERNERHPTQKPLALCDRIVKHFSDPKDIVFIPFAGSGSECVSSISNKRNFIATEINPNYIEIANERLDEILPRRKQLVKTDEKNNKTNKK